MWGLLLGLGTEALKGASSRAGKDARAVQAGAAACQARLVELGRTIDRLTKQRTVAVVAAVAAGLGGFALGYSWRRR